MQRLEIRVWGAIITSNIFQFKEIYIIGIFANYSLFYSVMCNTIRFQRLEIRVWGAMLTSNILLHTKEIQKLILYTNNIQNWGFNKKCIV